MTDIGILEIVKSMYADLEYNGLFSDRDQNEEIDISNFKGGNCEQLALFFEKKFPSANLFWSCKDTPKIMEGSKYSSSINHVMALVCVPSATESCVALNKIFYFELSGTCSNVVSLSLENSFKNETFDAMKNKHEIMYDLLKNEISHFRSKYDFEERKYKECRLITRTCLNHNYTDVFLQTPQRALFHEYLIAPSVQRNFSIRHEDGRPKLAITILCEFDRYLSISFHSTYAFPVGSDLAFRSSSNYGLFVIHPGDSYKLDYTPINLSLQDWYSPIENECEMLGSVDDACKTRVFEILYEYLNSLSSKFIMQK